MPVIRGLKPVRANAPPDRKRLRLRKRRRLKLRPKRKAPAKAKNRIGVDLAPVGYCGRIGAFALIVRAHINRIRNCGILDRRGDVNRIQTSNGRSGKQGTASRVARRRPRGAWSSRSWAQAESQPAEASRAVD